MSFLQSKFRVVFRIFVCLDNRNSFTLKLSRISRFETVTKNDEFVIFTKLFSRSVQASSSFTKTLSYEWEACNK